MVDDYLIECIENEGESSICDFKKDIYDFKNNMNKMEFLKDVLCFANGHYTGDKYIITGVKLYKDDTRELLGVTNEKIQDGAVYQNFIDENIEPSLIVDFIPVKYNNLIFGVFKIGEENTDRPYMMKKKYENLEAGFMKMRVGQRNANVTRRELDKMYASKVKEEKSNIVLKGIVDGNISDGFQVTKLSDEILTENSFIGLERIIDNLFNKIGKIEISRDREYGFVGGYLEKVCFDDEVKKEIADYANAKKIGIDDNFFYLGGLTESNLVFGRKLNGTDDEKEKYDSIIELFDYITQYKGLLKLRSKFNRLYYTELLLENTGNRFDDDVQITLKVKGEDFINFLDFPKPSKYIVKDVVEGNHLEKWMKISKHKDVNVHNENDKYVEPDYPQGHMGSFPGEYYEPDPEEYIDYYERYIDYLIDYDIVYSDNYYYIKTVQKQIRPNEKVFLPTRLFFTKQIDYIDYEIISKYNSEKKCGRIELEKDIV